jgi:prolipoprotein diacylglyceryltransferase
MFDNYWYGLLAAVGITVVISFARGVRQAFDEDKDKDG